MYGITLVGQLKGKPTKVNILNPGIVDTDICRNGDFPKWLRLLESLFNLLLKPTRKTPQQYVKGVVEVALGNNPAADQSVLITPKGKAI